jgi:uncharacterized SAM-dependent methyltransferase
MAFFNGLNIFSRETNKNIGKVNEIIFKEFIKRGYSLEGKTRVWTIADSRLWYITPEQAQAFLDLENSAEYQKSVIQKELDLISKHMPEIVQKLGTTPLNMVDLGCGNGKKAVIFLKALKDKVKLRYCPVDISSYMVEKAIAEVSKIPGIDKVITLRWNISDFENLENISSLLRFKDFQRNFLLLLGNTLGNFEIHELLYIIKESMKEGDYILIGNGLNNNMPENMLRAYNTPYVDKFCRHIPIKIGIPEDALEIGTRFVNSRVEIYYTITRDVEVTFLGKTIRFNKGDQIITQVSYKYEKNELAKFLKLYFKEVKMFVTEDSSYCLALCKK